jgi:hypothetical protein
LRLRWGRRSGCYQTTQDIKSFFRFLYRYRLFSSSVVMSMMVFYVFGHFYAYWIPVSLSDCLRLFGIMQYSCRTIAPLSSHDISFSGRLWFRSMRFCLFDGKEVWTGKQARSLAPFAVRLPKCVFGLFQNRYAAFNQRITKANIQMPTGTSQTEPFSTRHMRRINPCVWKRPERYGMSLMVLRLQFVASFSSVSRFERVFKSVFHSDILWNVNSSSLDLMTTGNRRANYHSPKLKPVNDEGLLKALCVDKTRKDWQIIELTSLKFTIPPLLLSTRPNSQNWLSPSLSWANKAKLNHYVKLARQLLVDARKEPESELLFD